MSNKEKAKELATNGNTFVKNNMTWNVILPKYIQFYEDLLKNYPITLLTHSQISNAWSSVSCGYEGSDKINFENFSLLGNSYPNSW